LVQGDAILFGVIGPYVLDRPQDSFLQHFDDPRRIDWIAP